MFVTGVVDTSNYADIHSTYLTWFYGWCGQKLLSLCLCNRLLVTYFYLCQHCWWGSMVCTACPVCQNLTRHHRRFWHATLRLRSAVRRHLHRGWSWAKSAASGSVRCCWLDRFNESLCDSRPCPLPPKEHVILGRDCCEHSYYLSKKLIWLMLLCHSVSRIT